MTWVRTNRRLGAWIGLFALALQLALSFGHIHLDAARLPAPVATAAAQAGNDGGASGGDNDRIAHDFCAICASLSLTASAALPGPLALAVPLDRAPAWFADAHTALIALSLERVFQARAPPSLA